MTLEIKNMKKQYKGRCAERRSPASESRVGAARQEGAEELKAAVASFQAY